jgi:hypothetical protein
MVADVVVAVTVDAFFGAAVTVTEAVPVPLL